MIPTDLYDAYSAALTENDRQARAALATVIARLDPADIDGIRDALLEAYPALVKLYGTRAAQVALEFYTGVREAQKVALPLYAYLPTGEFEEVGQEAVTDVRREIGGLYSGESTISAFTSTMQGLATKRTMGMADSTLYALANADPAHPLFAMVPNAGACGWCVLMGARGFVDDKNTIGSRPHSNCKCTLVADFDTKNPALEGYDHEALHDVYTSANTPENMSEWYKEWNAMTDDEKAKYVRRVKQKDGLVKEVPRDWSTYARNRTVQEMNRLMGKTGVTSHCRDMMEERGVTNLEFFNARAHPLHKKPVVYDESGRPSYQLVGANATIAINPDTDMAVSVWRTGTRMRRRYEQDGNRGIDPTAD